MGAGWMDGSADTMRGFNVWTCGHYITLHVPGVHHVCRFRVPG